MDGRANRTNSISGDRICVRVITYIYGGVPTGYISTYSLISMYYPYIRCVIKYCGITEYIRFSMICGQGHVNIGSTISGPIKDLCSGSPGPPGEGRFIALTYISVRAIRIGNTRSDRIPLCSNCKISAIGKTRGRYASRHVFCPGVAIIGVRIFKYDTGVCYIVARSPHISSVPPHLSLPIRSILIRAPGT